MEDKPKPMYNTFDWVWADKLRGKVGRIERAIYKQRRFRRIDGTGTIKWRIVYKVTIFPTNNFYLINEEDINLYPIKMKFYGRNWKFVF